LEIARVQQVHPTAILRLANFAVKKGPFHTVARYLISVHADKFTMLLKLLPSRLQCRKEGTPHFLGQTLQLALKTRPDLD